jgi:2-polyprenyl-3-methyl-5-hydroxy-6-metoxy-1,4-benzoquinol methylase
MNGAAPTLDLISPAYLQEQIRLHAQPRGYGQRGSKWAKTVLRIADEFQCRTVLDYGCGQGSLAVALTGTLAVSEYDPAIRGKESLPEPADLVVCTDVLEHVESPKIYAVVGHLARLTKKKLFLVVSLVETAKTLSDGRQAHILIRNVDWWKYLLRAHHFNVIRELQVGPKEKWHKQWVAILG